MPWTSAGSRGRLDGLVALPGVATLGRLPDTDRLAQVVAAFGASNVAMDVQRHRRREQEAANQALLDMADALGLAAVATNGVRHAASRGRALVDVLTCIREKRTLAAAGRLLAENAERHLKAPRGRWRRSSPTVATFSATSRPWPTACDSPSTTSATASPSTRCRRERRCSRSWSRRPTPARAPATVRTTSAPAGRSSES